MKEVPALIVQFVRHRKDTSPINQEIRITGGIPKVLAREWDNGSSITSITFVRRFPTEEVTDEEEEQTKE